MGTYQLGEMETRFAEIIWENEPLTSMELARRAEQAFGWKKTTSYTVLKRLCEKGLFRNEKTISLPAFLAAFTKKRRLTEEDVKELRRMIEEQ